MKRIVLLLVSLLMLRPNTAALADAKDKLTLAQMQAAVMVADGQPTSRLAAGPAALYRLAECPPEGPCYFAVVQTTTYHNIPTSNATLSCGLDIFNNVGLLVARLKQNINVTFWNNDNSPPLTLNWGDSRGSETFCCWYTWTSLNEPAPNPAWGVYIGPDATAWANTSGVLTYAPPMIFPTQRSVSSRWMLDSQGLHCT